MGDAENTNKENKGLIDHTIESDKGTRTIEWLQLGVNAVLAAVGIVAIIIYLSQLSAMNKTLTEIEKQTPEIQRQARAAQGQLTQAKSDSAANSASLSQQIDAANRQARAAQDSARATQQQTETSARPWIAISEISLAGPITLNMRGEATTMVHVTAQDIGKTPAREVALIVELGAEGSQHHELERLCALSFVSTEQGDKYGQVLLPTDTLGKDETRNIQINLKPWTLVERKPAGTGYTESLRLDKNGPPPSQEEIIYSMPSSVIGCVQYKSFTSEIPYYTGFTYGLYPKVKDINAVIYNVRFDRRTGEATGAPNKSLKGNGSITVPVEWMGLTPNFGWGNDVVR